MNGMEVKKKFRKDGIELDDARQNVSREKHFEKNISPTRDDFRDAGAAESRQRVEIVAVAGKHRKARALHAHLDTVIGLRAIGLRG
jgi:hypothetical protein